MRRADAPRLPLGEGKIEAEHEATNWPAELAIRPAVIARKLSGCNRTDRGARAQERTMSVARTAWLQDLDVIDLFMRTIREPGLIDLGLVPEPG